MLGVDPPPDEICPQGVWNVRLVDGQRCRAQSLRHDVATIQTTPRILKALTSERDVIGPLKIEKANERHGLRSQLFDDQRHQQVATVVTLELK